MGGRRSRAASSPIRRALTKAMAIVAISVVSFGIVPPTLSYRSGCDPADELVPILPCTHGMRIEDYALIGDCETGALIGRNGSIDWLCWPRFDSGACFAALLGNPEHGRWRIAPAGDVTRVERRYRGDSLILETTFVTDGGEVTVVDFMPPVGTQSELVRMVVGVRGEVAMHVELILRFAYGALVPWVTKLPGGGLCAIAGPDMVV